LAYTNWIDTLEKRTESVLAMERPKNLKRLHGFIGAINYYRDMRPHKSHIIARLIRECGAHKKTKIPKKESSNGQT